MSTFTISPPSCWSVNSTIILDSSYTDQSHLFSTLSNSATLDLIGDVSLAGQTISYNGLVNIIDPATSLAFTSIVFDYFTVEWKYPPVCDSMTTSLDVLMIPDQVFTFTGSHSLVITIPADTLSTSRGDASYCGTRFGNTYDSNTLLADPAYFSLDPTIGYNSGESVTIPIVAADYTLVGEHIVSLKWTITGTNVLSSTMFKITFTCDNTQTLPNVVIGSTAPTLAFTHDTLSNDPTIAQMSSWTLDVGSPCFTYSGFVVYDWDSDVTSNFGAFDEVNFILPLLGNAGLSGQTIDYFFFVVIQESINGNLHETFVEEFSVQWSTACDTAVLDPISV